MAPIFAGPVTDKNGVLMNSFLQSTAKRKSFLLVFPAAVLSFLFPRLSKSVNPASAPKKGVKAVVHPNAVQRQKKA